MLNPEWKSLVQPPPGHVLVARDVPAVQKHGLYVPETYRNSIRMALATVISADRRAALLDGSVPQPGWRVMLASSAGKPILFGYTPENESELWVIEPAAILCRFTEPVNEAEDRGSHFLRNQKALQARTPTFDDRMTEGDREAPR